jgi:hypothetical protein
VLPPVSAFHVFIFSLGGENCGAGKAVARQRRSKSNEELQGKNTSDLSIISDS